MPSLRSIADDVSCCGAAAVAVAAVAAAVVVGGGGGGGGYGDGDGGGGNRGACLDPMMPYVLDRVTGSRSRNQS